MSITDFNLQPTHLQNAYVKLTPLKEDDFEVLYKVAGDPLLWEQHPQKNRYERDVFQQFFNEGIASKGAFLVHGTATNEVIGTSRYYHVDLDKNSVIIGYTFIARSYWGNKHNKALKTLMLDHAFNYVNTVFFVVGDHNFRSQKAVLKIGAHLVTPATIKDEFYHKENSCLFQLDKDVWIKVRDTYFPSTPS